MSFSNGFQSLLTIAEAYFYLGYSVIPLLGDLDPTRPKVPALPWSGFQNYRAAVNDYKQWFSESGFGGLGIVTGRISQLVVLDFDSEAIFNTFKAQYPDLLETHTVRSAGRGLPHLYFKLPPHLHLDSQKGQGIDLLSNGRYVVAPPTIINDQPYKVIRGGMPKTLTERDIRRLTAFLNGHKSHLPVLATHPIAPSILLKASRQDLQTLYKYLCQHNGRNEALFRTSLFARDTGWQKTETLNELVELHSQQTARGSHLQETTARRQHEAQRTIYSAFSRPAALHRSARQTADTDQLPNSVREALMQRKMTYVVRTLEGLRLSNIHDGQVFSTQQAELILKGLVGRDSIHKTLHWLAHSEPIHSPVSPQSNANAFAAAQKRLNNKNCFLLPERNQEKPQNGRPQHVYRMPTIIDLCQRLGVNLSSSDPLQRSDLASAHQTRMVLHAGLIKRRPDEYSRRWLAKRLGVSMPTINSYNRLIPIHSRPTYTETVIRWGNIERLPFDEPLRGAFLVTRSGKKYPALRIIASQMLANGQAIILKEQGRNFYWYGDGLPPLELLPAIQEQVPQQPVETFAANRVLEIQPLVCQPLMRVHQKPQKQGISVPINCRKPLANLRQEALADHIYTCINGNGQKTISRATARRISLMQPEVRVRTALDQLQQRKTVINPTGFLTTFLRSNHLK
ncbi:MAG: bifunctional DNA primase/polymerase [Anaerolineae bacterium]|nr:bifunctional DNA primase/polymerase [Anaerolineae bacterium]